LLSEQRRVEAQAERRRGELIVGRRGTGAARRYGNRAVGKIAAHAPALHAPADAAFGGRFRKRDAAGDAARRRAGARKSRAAPFVVGTQTNGGDEVIDLRLRAQTARARVGAGLAVGGVGV